MSLVKYLFLVFIFFAFVCKVSAQDKGKIISLKNVLISIEKQHNITFNYLDNEIVNINITPPNKNLPLSKKIAFLQEKSKLQFRIIDSKFIAIFSDKKIHKVSGYVFSGSDYSPLENANIAFEDGSKTTTNSSGYFEMKLEKIVPHSISYVGYETTQIPVEKSNQKSSTTIYLKPKTDELREVITTQFLTTGITKSIDGSFIIKPKKFGLLPGMIEPDILQTMLQLPGIYSTDESVSSINVRSGTHDQNLFLWNGIKMYQTGHFFGLISAFNPYLSHSAKIYKNGSSAFYGDGVSSVVDISTDSDLSENNKFSASINMLNADLYAKIKLSKNGFVEIAARRSLPDLIKTETYNQYYKKAFQNTTITNFSLNENVTYLSDEKFHFYDITTKYFQKIGTKNKLVLDFITVSDELLISQKNSEYNPTYFKDNSLYQKNYGANLSWETIWNAKNSTSFSASSSQYELDGENKDALNLDSKKQENIVIDRSAKIENNHKISSKFDFNNGYQLNSLQIENIVEDKKLSVTNYSKEKLTIHSVIAEGKFRDSISKINIIAGVRANYLQQFSKILIEPRFQFNYDPSASVNINLLGEIKSQNTFQIIEYHNDYFGIEKRRWIMANDSTVPIQTSKQISLGFNYKRSNWVISIDNYYKSVSGITSLSQGFQNQYEQEKSTGDYNVKGIEFFVQKKINHFLTWITYNFNDSKYNFPTFTNATFTNNFEIDHIISWAGIYERNNFKFAIGTKWHSGKPETSTANSEINYSDPLNPKIDFDKPNTTYLEKFFQVDASANYKWTSKGNIQYKFGVSLQNVLNRKNELNEYYRINTTFKSIEEIKTFGIGRTPNFSFRVIF